MGGRDAIVRILLTAPEEADGDMESLRTRRIEAIPLEGASLLPPVRPSKIVCVGRNYREHAAELGAADFSESHVGAAAAGRNGAATKDLAAGRS